MIKVAGPEDFDTVKSFVPKLIKESAYGKFFKSYELTEFMYEQYTTKPSQKFCVIVMNEGEPIGFAMFDHLTWPYIDHEVKFARIPFVYIEKKFRKKGWMDYVLIAFEEWAKLIGAKYCTVGTKQPKKNGYKKSEIVYMKEIQ